MSQIHIYSNGIVYCSVCVPKNMTQDQIEKAVNLKNPTGTHSSWKISKEKTFADKINSNPCQCEERENRVHYLMVC